MVDVLNLSEATARESAKSYDVSILVSIGLLAAALSIVILASVYPTEINPGDFALMNTYP
jgi:predicted nucleic acid-binding protein